MRNRDVAQARYGSFGKRNGEQRIPIRKDHPWGKQSSSRPSRVPGRMLLLLLAYRLFIAFTVRTSESPDEWWQSEEVAYYMVFGKGHLTWEWKEGIRSVVFPAFYALPFFILKALRLDNAYTVFWSARLVQAMLAWGIDVSMLILAGRIDRALARDLAEEGGGDRGSDDSSDCSRSGCLADPREPIDGLSRETASISSLGRTWFASPSVAKTTAWFAMFQWYLTYDGTRSYSNVAEGFLVMQAVVVNSYLAFLFIAGLACAVRITAVLALLPIFFFHVHREVKRRGVAGGLLYCAAMALAVVIAVVGGMMCIDYLFYHRWIFTPLKFLEFNIIKNVSQYYGVYPFWWYFVVAFPIMLGPHMALLLLLPFVMNRLFRLRRTWRRTRAIVQRLAVLLVSTIAMHSLVAHKEVRFLFPTLPLAIVLISVVVSLFARFPQELRFIPCGSGRRQRTSSSTYSEWCRCAIHAGWVTSLHGTFLILDVLLIGVLCYVYRQGGVGVITAVRNAPVRMFEDVDVLTHCYFTPGYARLHGRVGKLNLVDCPMELDEATGKPRVTDNILFTLYPTEYVYWRYTRQTPPSFSQVDLASSEGQQWLTEVRKRMPETEEARLPDGIIVFHSVTQELTPSFFEDRGYTLHKHVFHALKSFEEDEDCYVDLWVKTPLLLRH